jgi:hypothetical protein
VDTVTAQTVLLCVNSVSRENEVDSKWRRMDRYCKHPDSGTAYRACAKSKDQGFDVQGGSICPIFPT